jgi:hypothetical protein
MYRCRTGSFRVLTDTTILYCIGIAKDVVGQTPPATGQAAIEKICPVVAQGALGQTLHEKVQLILYSEDRTGCC